MKKSASNATRKAKAGSAPTRKTLRKTTRKAVTKSKARSTARKAVTKSKAGSTARKSAAKPKAGSTASAKTKTAQKLSAPFDTLKDYLEFMDQNSLSELEYTVPKMSIRLKKAGAVAAALPNQAGITSAPSTSVAANSGTEAGVVEAKGESRAHVVKSPFVGTFYRAPGPNQEPFVEEGRAVGQGDVLCIVEAMKLMNEIESDIKGRVLKVLVKDATPVEFGEPLFEIEPL